ncbi:hypothetical protein [Bremerella sp. P1]|uniref:hypothetical protein n=1 Tax=Bremerella sp. P1 TaxID=3026424 RepID=UPI00236882BE|nr:hypothetical protein [Bremerella sp. P1]WDI41825.1 hypothetical protein PSR63_25570 [Bremerella sp. P1]
MSGQNSFNQGDPLPESVPQTTTLDEEACALYKQLKDIIDEMGNADLGRMNEPELNEITKQTEDKLLEVISQYKN